MEENLTVSRRIVSNTFKNCIRSIQSIHIHSLMGIFGQMHQIFPSHFLKTCIHDHTIQPFPAFYPVPSVFCRTCSTWHCTFRALFCGRKGRQVQSRLVVTQTTQSQPASFDGFHGFPTKKIGRGKQYRHFHN